MLEVCIGQGYSAVAEEISKYKLDLVGGGWGDGGGTEPAGEYTFFYG
jgi:hypothetical protein